MHRKYILQLSQITPEERSLLAGAQLDMSKYNRSGQAVMDTGTLIPDGRLFGIRPHTRFTAFPAHTHNYVEMVYQITGKSVHHIQPATDITLKAGQLLLLGRGSTHAIERCGKEDIAVNFILIPQFFDNAALSIARSSALSAFLTGNLQRVHSGQSFLLFDISEVTVAENLLENLVVSELERGSLRLQQMTLELLLEHLAQMSQRLVVQSQEDREQAMVMEVLSTLERDRNVSLLELAEGFGVSDSCLSRIVRRRTGCTFTELLHTARFTRAAALLRDTQLSVADIAAAVGYDNTSFFYRQFAHRYGCTPNAYRQKIRQEKSDTALTSTDLVREGKD